jgi:membrane protease YdiL (CAAX protease family)
MLPVAPGLKPGPPRRFTPRRCWTEVLGVFALFFGVGVVAAVLSEAGQQLNDSGQPVAVDVLQGLSEFATAALAVVVVVALSRLRGLRAGDLGLAPSWGKRRAYRWQGLGVGVFFAAALMASAALLEAVSPHAHYPYQAVSLWHLLYELPAAVNAGIVEELVVVALLVTAAEQAGARPWAIYAVGIALRLSYHVYYGPGVVVFALWAAAAIWLFRRTRRITPLIVAHALYDTFGSLMHELPDRPGQVVAGFVGFALLGLAVLAIVRAIQIASRGNNSTPPVARYSQPSSQFAAVT